MRNNKRFLLFFIGNNNISASASLSGLEPNTTYYFRLDSQNKFGVVNGTILNFKTSVSSVATAPVATTQNASSINTSTATLRGTINPNGSETTYWFEYSTDPLLGSALIKTTNPVRAGANSSVTSVRTNISNLNSKTTYYFRVVAKNNLGTIRGDRLTFTTK